MKSSQTSAIVVDVLDIHIKNAPKYKGQPTKELDYGPWLKALTWGEKMKQNRTRE